MFKNLRIRFDSSAVAIACGAAGGISGAIAAPKGKE